METKISTPYHESAGHVLTVADKIKSFTDCPPHYQFADTNMG